MGRKTHQKLHQGSGDLRFEIDLRQTEGIGGGRGSWSGGGGSEGRRVGYDLFVLEGCSLSLLVCP